MSLYFPAVETHQLKSHYVNQTFKIDVMQPAREQGENGRFPTVYVTDGNLTFDMFKGLSYLLHESGTHCPRYVLVGIGYPGNCPLAGALLRGREFCFPGYPQLNRTPPRIEGVALPEAGAKDAYGADEFQQFLESELIPLIDGGFGTLLGERTYFGHSAAAGFGFYTLLSRPQLFRNYILSSPGLTFDGVSSGAVRYDNYDFVLRRAQAYIDAGDALDGRKLFLSVGSEEEFETRFASWRLTSSFYRMAALLKSQSIPGLEVFTKVFQGENHATVLPLAFMHGLQAVLGRPNRD